ncbi:hypothetical protein N658DRAFT_315256 [Parathielavia hyrcaniae]|uniref:Secreted protein n=1 Tax=Parathielavia hyrcaniae TaxID=113614 RepID=A0AAN6SY19_9PEZI|nr:hypothetical protein N658DRAFT_315256 [Parathielavia hyrcaniae]
MRPGRETMELRGCGCRWCWGFACAMLAPLFAASSERAGRTGLSSPWRRRRLRLPAPPTDDRFSLHGLRSEYSKTQKARWAVLGSARTLALEKSSLSAVRWRRQSCENSSESSVSCAICSPSGAISMVEYPLDETIWRQRLRSRPWLSSWV